jgi:hypothetical protein
MLKLITRLFARKPKRDVTESLIAWTDSQLRR